MDNGNLKSWPHLQGFAPQTAKIVDSISKGRVGEVLTDEQLGKIAGEDCGDLGGRRHVYSAIKYVERVHGVVWRRMRDAGAIKCLDSDERVEVAHVYRQHISRSSKRAVRVISTVQIEDVKAERKPEVLALAAQLGALATFASTAAHKRLASHNVSSHPDLKGLLAPFEK